jgi:hypothetical protein
MIESDLKMKGSFWVYSGVAFFITLFSFFVLKETKGLTDDETKQLYSPRKKK